MGKKLRILLLLALAAAAFFCARGAYRSVRPFLSEALPGEVYRSLLNGAGQAEFLLRARNGYIAVYPNRRGAQAAQTTRIALSTLRAADRAMIERGIPAADRRSLLLLLEDLGS